VKNLKFFEQHSNNDIMLDEESAIKYLKSIDFFESHGFNENDSIILDNISNIVYKYRWLKDNKVNIHRSLDVPSFEDINLNKVGYFWSFSKDGVGNYDSGVLNTFNKNWKDKKTKSIVLTAVVDKKSINWEETLVSNAIYGDEQFECYLNKGSDIIITHINNEKLTDYIKAKS
tara:strand:+ start:4799 stop:5317 length:519 start_codon:yes stop_codon:yes gene_type:complete